MPLGKDRSPLPAPVAQVEQVALKLGKPESLGLGKNACKLAGFWNTYAPCWPQACSASPVGTETQFLGGGRYQREGRSRPTCSTSPRPS